MKKFWFFIFIVIIGALAGILGSQFLAPYLAHAPSFDGIGWLKNGNSGTTIIQKTEEKTIREDTAVEDAISKIDASAVGVIGGSKPAISKTIKKPLPTVSLFGTGFLVTSDGLILAASSTVPAKNYEYSVVRDGKTVSAEVVKRDDNLGLVLLKIQQSNLPVVSWADFDSLRLGVRLVLFGVDASNNFQKFVDWGIAASFSGKNFSVSMDKEPGEANGAPIITTLGEVAGMVLVDKNGNLKVVASDVIKDFLGQ
ncbi:MAG: hypothetical protein CO161_03480 [Candidatus Portnoybacteria bacterium CG_4_9_14_3_um_filter_44_9]|uniref:Serine protease n=1 Tax=Candidatus Portnoybacteria bacterium CG_4_9_14_3_um_filter_44_9 TaxID=1974806 RepID=A0A2M7YJ17_9BACT|nr:MAG: hypothetical protein AUK17_01765 [Parcubacteria group bacterium CG2_30_44_18]PJA62989.1 MAG: hypothetical protein CO161_03480 [Candidatus Portnoybacteria bacterium CG_4_9_14_3_um_filter_44_9]